MTGTDFRPNGIREPDRLAAATCALVVLTLVTAACGSERDNPRAPETCADLNGDSFVDKSDIQTIVTRYGTRQGDPDYDAFYDLNHDGFIDQTDITLSGNQFGKSCTR